VSSTASKTREKAGLGRAREERRSTRALRSSVLVLRRLDRPRKTPLDGLLAWRGVVCGVCGRIWERGVARRRSNDVGITRLTISAHDLGSRSRLILHDCEEEEERPFALSFLLVLRPSIGATTREEEACDVVHTHTHTHMSVSTPTPLRWRRAAALTLGMAVGLHAFFLQPLAAEARDMVSKPASPAS
jgi:hypothetical protein